MMQCSETLQTVHGETYLCVEGLGHAGPHVFNKYPAVGCGWPEPVPSVWTSVDDGTGPRPGQNMRIYYG